MDNKSTATDNRNTPTTYPQDAPLVPVTPTVISNNVKAPVAADPLNGGVPQQSAADVTNSSIRADDELGGTGTYIFSGFLSNADYNPDFSGPNRIKLFDEMRLSDATVRLGLAAVKYPILAARWYIKPGDGDNDNSPRVQLIREELMNNPNFSWTQFRRQALSFCENGNSFFEKVWRKRRDGKIGWLKFAPRLSNTIFRYTLSDGKTPGITQILPTSGNAEIPMWKMLMFVLDMEGANYEGRSLLRYCYKHFFYKDLYYKIDSIAAQRQGCGFPVLYIPPQATPQDKATALEIVRNIRVNEQSYAALPTGFDLKWQDMKTQGLKDVKDMIMHHDRQILKAFMAHFLDMGASSAGTRNLSDNQSDFFYLSENYIAQTFQDPVNIAIRELIDLNFSNTKPDEYPTLEYAGLGKVNLKDYGQFIKDTVESGALIPDDDLERHLRQVADMPESNRMSGENNDDPETKKLREAIINPANPNQVEQKKPTRYLNSEQENDAVRFMEDVLSLKSSIGNIITMKEHAA